MEILQSLNVWLSKIFGAHAWLAEVLVVLAVTVLLAIAKGIIYRRMRKRLARKVKKESFNISVLDAIHRPVGLLIWVLGIAKALEILQSHFKDVALLALVSPLKDLLVIVLLVWFATRFIKKYAYFFIKRKKARSEEFDETVVHIISQLSFVTVIILGGLIILQRFGIPISGVLAFGGVGGIAIGFAAKDLLGNFFGGLMIFLDRPFKVGDWVRSPDRNIEGTVEYIGWRLTRIRTFNKRPLYVPNGIFSTLIVENPSRMHNRRINATIGLRYDDASKIAQITNDIEDMLKSHPDVDSEQTLMVYLANFGASSLDIVLYCFTKTILWIPYQKVQQDIFLKCIEIIEKHEAQCAFPTQTLHFAEELSGLAIK